MLSLVQKLICTKCIAHLQLRSNFVQKQFCTETVGDRFSAKTILPLVQKLICTKSARAYFYCKKCLIHLQSCSIFVLKQICNKFVKKKITLNHSRFEIRFISSSETSLH